MLLVIETEVQGEKAQLFDPNVPAHLQGLIKKTKKQRDAIFNKFWNLYGPVVDGIYGDPSKKYARCDKCKGSGYILFKTYWQALIQR